MAFDPAFHRHRHMLIVIRWSLPTALMRPIEILVQNHAQVTFAVDQHSVGALAALPFGSTARRSSSPLAFAAVSLAL
ncbi:hypothetical protein SAMN05421869_13418 [Nonomuraea jiangxiensis]|uniref:Uncharacterized protein n=1 Tax=Nonomuraea jiangxiensis TaxID=633440 RepID=A0A1G9PK29_9ACTN|nr:hypothetical protein SAMN05421869_13418 [Nonomuraea jiangxiensis]